MNVLRKVSPLYVPAHLAGQSEVVILRERILQGILLFFATIGTVVIGMGVVEALEAGSILLAGFYFGLYIGVAVMAIFREIPYGLRGRIVVFLFYLLALSEIFDSGMLGEMRVSLLMMTAVTAIFYDYKNIIASIALSVFTIVGLGIYVSTQAVTGPLANFNDGTNWPLSAVMTASMSIILSGAIYLLFTGLQSNLERMSALTQSLEGERDTLDLRIQERTRSVNRRMVQLRTAAEISKTIGALSDPETLLQRVVDLIKDRFDLYYVGIFLLDAERKNAVLRSGTGEAGSSMIAIHHSLPIAGSSMIGWAITNRTGRVALDVGSEAVRFNNPYLPHTRSELALPVIAHDRVLGAMTIQSDRASAFDENDIAILQGIADSIAIALENDRLYNEMRRSLEEVRVLNREYLQRAWSETIDTYGDLSYDYETPGLPTSTGKTNTVQVPLMLRDEVMGYITLELDHAELSPEDATFVENITTQTAIALENARLLHETERRAVQEQKLNELATRFSRALSIDEILRSAAQELGQLPAVADVSVQITPVASAVQALSHPPVSGGANGKEHTA